MASAVVLVHHALLASSVALAESLRERGAAWPTNLLTESPLEILWGGQEAVMVFFALSGFVLVLPYASGKTLDVPRFYLSRAIRLYLPVWAALVFAALTHLLVQREPIDGATWWLNLHTEPYSHQWLLENVVLLHTPGGGWFTTVLWSLKWEVLFSAAVPLVLLAARYIGRRPAAWAFVALGLVALAASAEIASVFLLGSALAFNLDTVRGWAHRRTRYLPVILAVYVVCGLTMVWWWQPGPLANVALVTAAVGAVLLPLISDRTAWLLRTSPVQWVGRRSFSLYLVHEPIVVSLAFATGAALSPWLMVPASVALALPAAALFFRLVEFPVHRLARRVGRRRPASAEETQPAASGAR